MRLETLRDRILGFIVHEDGHIPPEFVNANWEYLKHYVDESIIKSNKYLLNRKPSRSFLTLEFLLSIGLFCICYFKLHLSILNSSLITMFIVLNVEMIYYREYVRLAHLIFVKFNYKVRNYCSLKDRFGYNIVYMGVSPDNPNRILITSAFKPKKNLRIVNSKLYIVHPSSLYSVIMDYKHNRNSIDFEAIKYDVFLSVNQEHINFMVLEELEKYNKEISDSDRKSYQYNGHF